MPANTSTNAVKNRKIALITGSARRIGASIAKMLHQNGYNTLIHYNKSECEAKQLVKDLNNIRSDSAFAIQANLREITELSTLCEATIAQWGQLDLLINNASCFYPTNGFKSEDWDSIINTNLRAPFYLSQTLADALKVTSGSIINLVDIYAERPLKDHSIYNISKAGIAMMTQTLARELAPDVRVNGVSPGAILWPEKEGEQTTPKEGIISQTPLARCGTPEDICDAVNYLASSTFVTGQIIKVDGGRSLYL